jgi:enamine deaminase RidA (YjgF/YER057c/UK114 family)
MLLAETKEDVAMRCRNRYLGTAFGALLAGAVCLPTIDAIAVENERINPPGIFKHPNFTRVVTVKGGGKMIFIAGQVGATAEGKVAGAGMKEQTEQVLKNLQTVLKSQGLDFSHVAKINIFTTSIPEFRAQDVAEIRARYFGQNRPASTLVQISALASPEYKIEIEAIAVAP